MKTSKRQQHMARHTFKAQLARHGLLLMEVEGAIEKLFSDSTVPQYQTRTDLQDIIDGCQMKIELIDRDLRMKGGH